MADKNKSYTIYLRGEIEVGVTIGALSLEDALIKAKEIKVGRDILQKDVDYNDGDLNVVGVLQ